MHLLVAANCNLEAKQAAGRSCPFGFRQFNQASIGRAPALGRGTLERRDGTSDQIGVYFLELVATRRNLKRPSVGKRAFTRPTSPAFPNVFLWARELVGGGWSAGWPG